MSSERHRTGPLVTSGPAANVGPTPTPRTVTRFPDSWLTPDTTGYDAARRLWNTMID